MSRLPGPGHPASRKAGGSRNPACLLYVFPSSNHARPESLLTDRLTIKTAVRLPRRLSAAARGTLILAFWVIACGGGPAVANGEPALWSVSLFGGPASRVAMSETLKSLPDYADSGDRILAMALSREMIRPAPSLGLELEVMAAHHFGKQRYQEFALALNTRWHDFPWNRWLPTTMAVGIGPSYTTAYSDIEFEPGDTRSRVLNQFNLEADFGLPSRPNTSLLVRLQHRSGMFGLIDQGSSDFLTFGVRQRF